MEFELDGRGNYILLIFLYLTKKENTILLLKYDASFSVEKLAFPLETLHSLIYFFLRPHISVTKFLHVNTCGF